MAIKGKVLSKPQFLNIQSINPMVSKVDIKVFYIGENQHNMFISEETGIKIMSSIRGCPIVGHFIQEKQDYHDHDTEITQTIQGEKIRELTIPYGFVDLNAKIWKQSFKEMSYEGELVVREYFCTQGYLWTGQYPECKRILMGENNQSMELDPKTVIGKWADKKNSDTGFFIIDDAVITKLCILGEDVAPCFEGSNFTPSKLEFSLNKEEEDLMFNFMFKLREQLEGEVKNMDDKNKKTTEEEKKETNFLNKEKEDGEKDSKKDLEKEDEQKDDPSSKEKDKSTKNNEEDEKEKEDKFSKEEEDDKSKCSKEKDNEVKFSMEELLGKLESTLSSFSNRLDKIEQNTKSEKELKEEKEKEDKEKLVSKFSKMTFEEMQKVLGEKTEEETIQKQNKIDKGSIVFSNVNNGANKISDKESDLPEYLEYIKNFQ